MSKLYDLSELREMSGNDEAFVQEMLSVFLKNNRDYLSLLNKSFEEKEWKSVKFNAHKIKPSIMLFKIETLRQEILDLNEFSGKEINLEQIPPLVSKINEVLCRVFDQISDEIKKED
ncbi:MAG: hypothetical protein CL840_05675 [Crocinitomicaceae bacterium]|nr:hypothetical protein [Crocinitomicaceae bacterium]|tara:strand:+ start:1969 stop:2319 length:351 start_codon:yes stop_codon:yes gene_type:complete